ncbi:MAG TPA: M28 family peptidase [Longimicrobiales bacterium]
MRVLLLPFMMVVLSGCPSSGGDASGNGALEAQGPPFSADAALAHIRTQVGFGPRVAGTPGHAQQLQWMIDYLRERADTVELQPFTHTHSVSNQQLAMTNVIARFNPQATERVLLLTHWDTRPTADYDADEQARTQPVPGANDGGSGTAVLLEIANILKTHKPGIGVDLLFVDGEDYGPDEPDMYLGAKYFAANAGSYRPLYAVLIDMIADQTPRYGIEDTSQRMAPEVVQRVWGLAEDLGYGQYFPRTNVGAIGDDHVPLNQAGIRTANIIDCCDPPWHTLDDNLENVSPVGLGIVGTVLVELIFREGQ